MNYVDPTGMIIDHVSQEEWNRQKDLINRVVSSLNKKINKTNEKALAKGWTKEKTEKKNSENAERLSILNNTLQTMEMMELNQNEVYHLDKTNIDQQIEGNVTRIGDQIHISYNSTALFVHEVTHAGQGLTGDLAFLPNGCTLYQDIFDEVNAYKAQYAYMNYPLNQATPLKIRNMETEGMMPYAPEGGNNTGIIPVNNRSDINTIMQAYPWDFKKNLKK